MRTPPITIENVEDIFKYSREDLISYCSWNDKNGCFTDEDSKDEELPCLTWNHLYLIIEHWITDGCDAEITNTNNEKSTS